MRFFSADIEADGLLEPFTNKKGEVVPALTKLHCASIQEFGEDFETVKPIVTLTKMDHIDKLFGDPDITLILHNGMAYDAPAVNRILGTNIKVRVVDTLFLSWYLYPKNRKHGLESWGIDLGIIKPAVTDWADQPLEVYVHRCEEDVKIQTALWQQMWKHLLLLYGDEEGAWRLVDYLMGKARAAAMQEKFKWKVNITAATELYESMDVKWQEARVALEARMPDAKKYRIRERPKKPFKMNGELSKTGLGWEETVRNGVPKELQPARLVDYIHPIKELHKTEPPNAGSVQQLKDWLFSLGWEPETFKVTRDFDTKTVKSVPQIKIQVGDREGEMCDSIAALLEAEPAIEYLRDMSMIKHRMGVVGGLIRNVDVNNMVIAGIQGLTNTLRFKHRVCVNIPSVRKPYGKEIRSLLIAQGAGTELCGSDCSSLEDRTKQHYMWDYDPDYVREMMGDDFDPHLDMAMAANLISQTDADLYKAFDKAVATAADMVKHDADAKLRHSGKSTNYAATYGAQGPTVAKAAGVSEEIGNKLVEAYWLRNWSLKAIADACEVKTSRGMKWLWNPVANLWYYLKADKDRFSTLNQGTGTYAFDKWVHHILEARPQLTAQFHDEVILEVKVGHRDAVIKLLKDAMALVNAELKLNRDLDCDVDFGISYAEIH